MCGSCDGFSSLPLKEMLWSLGVCRSEQAFLLPPSAHRKLPTKKDARKSRGAKEMLFKNTGLEFSAGQTAQNEGRRGPRAPGSAGASQGGAAPGAHPWSPRPHRPRHTWTHSAPPPPARPGKRPAGARGCPGPAGCWPTAAWRDGARRPVPSRRPWAPAGPLAPRAASAVGRAPPPGS